LRIYAQKGGTSTRQERLDLATLLIKFGYVVSCGKAKIDGKAVDYVEFSTKPQTVVEPLETEDSNAGDPSV
jgi:hypothetical protein